MKIFNLSLQRTATQSFHAFMEQRVKSIHFVKDNFVIPNNIEEYYAKYKVEYIDSDYVAFSDSPIPLFAERLLKEYADSIFLCFRRNKGEWSESVLKLFERHTIPHNITATDSLFYQEYCQKHNMRDITKEDLEIAYDNYFKMLSKHEEKICFIDMLDDPMNISKIISEITGINFNMAFPHKDFLKA